MIFIQIINGDAPATPHQCHYALISLWFSGVFIYKLHVWFGWDELLLPISFLFAYLFIYFVSLPVCKIARVPSVAWQRAWQWALLTLRPRPRTARALKIDPGRLTLIENKKNARRAVRRSHGSTGKRGHVGWWERWDMRLLQCTLGCDTGWAIRQVSPKFSYLWLIWCAPSVLNISQRWERTIASNKSNFPMLVNKKYGQLWKSLNWIVYKCKWNAFWLNNERWSNECAALLVFGKWQQ